MHPTDFLLWEHVETLFGVRAYLGADDYKQADKL